MENGNQDQVLHQKPQTKLDGRLIHWEESLILSDSSPTVLLVDDESEILEIGAAFLAKLGYSALRAQGGVEALSMFRSQPAEIDVLIADVVMPKMPGLHLARILKSFKPNLKVIFMSGRLIATELSTINTICFLQKPFTLKTMSQKLGEII